MARLHGTVIFVASTNQKVHKKKKKTREIIPMQPSLGNISLFFVHVLRKSASLISVNSRATEATVIKSPNIRETRHRQAVLAVAH